MKRASVWSLTAAVSQLLLWGSAHAIPSFDPLLSGQEVSVDAGRVTIDLLPRTAGISEASTWWAVRDVLPSGLLTNGLSYSLGARLAVDGFMGWPNWDSLQLDLPLFRMAADPGWQIKNVSFTLSGSFLANAYGGVLVQSEGVDGNTSDGITPTLVNRAQSFNFNKTLAVNANQYDFSHGYSNITADIYAESSGGCNQYDASGSCTSYYERRGLAWVQFDTLTIQASVQQVTAQVPEAQAHVLALLGLAAVVVLGRQQRRSV